MTAGTAENVLLEHFKPWAIRYVSQLRNGAINVRMNNPKNTSEARRVLRMAGYTVCGS